MLREPSVTGCCGRKNPIKMSNRNGIKERDHAHKALHGGVTEGAQDWVTEHTRLLLTTPIGSTVSTLRTMVKTGKKSSGAQKALQKCATYLENNAVALDYENALKSGYPIAMGNV